MDYRQFQTAENAERGATLTLRDFSGEPITDPKGKPITLTVLGRDSKAFRDVLRDLARKRMNDEITDADILESIEERSVKLLAAVTTGWSWMGDPASFDAAALPDGGLDPKKIKALPFSADNAEMIYTRFPPWREQVDAFVQDRANFIPASAKR